MAINQKNWSILIRSRTTGKSNFVSTNTRQNLEKVAKLVDGFETPFGLELLATVHWVIKNENADSIDSIVEKIYAWGDKKKRFSKRQIEIAYRTLNEWFWTKNNPIMALSY